MGKRTRCVFVFGLTAVLGTLDPAKLNETLGAVSQALSGRGEKIGQAFTDLDSFMAKFQPTLPALSHDIAVSPAETLKKIALKTTNRTRTRIVICPDSAVGAFGGGVERGSRGRKTAERTTA